MDTSPARVDPHDVLETEIVAQHGGDDLDSHGHEAPAFVADVCLVAAGSDIIVVRQIYIKADFFGARPEGCDILEQLPVARI